MSRLILLFTSLALGAACGVAPSSSPSPSADDEGEQRARPDRTPAAGGDGGPPAEQPAADAGSPQEDEDGGGTLVSGDAGQPEEPGDEVIPVEAWPPAQGTLDSRRRRLIELAAGVPILDEDPAYPTPNVALKYGWSERDYYEAALALFAMADLGESPAWYRGTANKLLRYALHRWPADVREDLVGQYTSSWDHRGKTLAVRLVWLYAGWLEDDNAAELEQRVALLVGAPFTQKSENIKWNHNSAIFLAHERTGQTAAPSFAVVRAWVVGQLENLGENGMWEWGAGGYSQWTLGSVLNLADFAADQEVRTLSTLVVDYLMARRSGFTKDGMWASGAVREYGHGIHGVVDPETQIAETWFVRPPLERYWIEFAVTSFRPLDVVATLYRNPNRFEARITEQGRWRHRSFRGDRFLIATQQSLVDGHYSAPGETHDVVSAFVQSTGGEKRRVVPAGARPGAAKWRSLVERGFGYGPVAIVNGGGTTKKAWTAGIQHNVPIRLFYDAAFTRELESGWAFLTDGVVYVGWAPTLGDPIDDEESAQFSDPQRAGSWLRSSFLPDEQGETAVLEVGDASTHGSFQAFKTELLARNDRPRFLDEQVSYLAPDGALLEVGSGFARVGGVDQDPSEMPRASMFGVEGFTVTDGETTVTFDFAAGTLSGEASRMEARAFGVSE